MDITLAELLFSNTAGCSKHSYMQWVVKIMMIWIFAAIIDIVGMGMDLKSGYGMGGFMVGSTTLFLLFPIVRLNAARCRARGQSPNQHWSILGPTIAIILIVLISFGKTFSEIPAPPAVIPVDRYIFWVFMAFAMILHFMLVGIPQGAGEASARPAAAKPGLFGPMDLPPLPEEPSALQGIADYSASPELPPGDPALDAPHPPMTGAPDYAEPYVPQPPAAPPPYMPPAEPAPYVAQPPTESVPYMPPAEPAPYVPQPPAVSAPDVPQTPSDAAAPPLPEEEKPADEPPPLPPLA